jgi:hypothetical protein
MQSQLILITGILRLSKQIHAVCCSSLCPQLTASKITARDTMKMVFMTGLFNKQ